MKIKYEIIEIDQTEITVDVSLLFKTEEMFFNATEMAKLFSKRPNDFWKQPQNEDYLDALITLGEGNKTREDFIQTKKGKYGGTYFHKELALQFARWLSPLFAVKLDRWIANKLKDAAEWKRKRLEAKTGFLPMTEAILKHHDPAMHYHFSNEADLINRIVLGMSAKEYREKQGVDNVRDAVTAAELSELERLQRINTGLIEIGMSFEDRKENLIRCHKNELVLLGEVG